MSSKLGRSVIASLFRLRPQIGDAAWRVQRRRLLAALAIGALAACADESEPESVAPPAPPPGPERFLVQQVDRLSLGRTHDGFMLAAFGVAETAGWRLPRLEPAGSGLGPDGFLTFDFTAIPPAEGVAAPEGARRVRADVELSPTMLRGAAGVRVRAASGAVEAAFGGGE
jgi:hypothetical protein